MHPAPGQEGRRDRRAAVRRGGLAGGAVLHRRRARRAGADRGRHPPERSARPRARRGLGRRRPALRRAGAGRPRRSPSPASTSGTGSTSRPGRWWARSPGEPPASGAVRRRQLRALRPRPTPPPSDAIPVAVDRPDCAGRGAGGGRGPGDRGPDRSDRRTTSPWCWGPGGRAAPSGWGPPWPTCPPPTSPGSRRPRSPGTRVGSARSRSRAAGPGLPRAHPPLRAPGSRGGRPSRPGGRGLRLPCRGPHQRLRRDQRDLPAR